MNIIWLTVCAYIYFWPPPTNRLYLFLFRRLSIVTSWKSEQKNNNSNKSSDWKSILTRVIIKTSNQPKNVNSFDYRAPSANKHQSIPLWFGQWREKKSESSSRLEKQEPLEILGRVNQMEWIFRTKIWWKNGEREKIKGKIRKLVEKNGKNRKMEKNRNNENESHFSIFDNFVEIVQISAQINWLQNIIFWAKI